MQHLFFFTGIKQLLAAACLSCLLSATAFTQSPYTPAPGNIAARRQFQDEKFGMFIHWGAFSVLGAGEWVMNERNIRISDYKRLQHFFNPISFDARQWVTAAKN